MTEERVQHGQTHCDIAVVGAGPAGLAAAVALRQAGFDVVCTGPAPDPGKPDRRTTALLGGSLRFLESLGLWDSVRDAAAPLRTLHIIDRTGRLFRAPDIVFDAAEIGEEAFGYNIPNDVLVRALLDRLGDAYLPIAGVEAVETDSESVRLSLPGEQRLSARLVVGADGRNSLCREAAGIGTRSWTYDQTAIVANFHHSRPHYGACTELHFSSGPFTIVPLPGDRSSLVWVERPAEAARLAELDSAAFAATIGERLQGLLGDVEQVTARSAFPLAGLIARGMAKGRIALIGEAAHVIPPIGAQGLNLGFRDVTDLVGCVEGVVDPGAPEVLAAYERARRSDVLARTFATHFLNRTLISSLAPFQIARGMGFAGLATIPPLRRLAMRQGMSRGRDT
jgi:2-octaprenyl-6-methoxyphenol hydroxylase